MSRSSITAQPIACQRGRNSYEQRSKARRPNHQALLSLPCRFHLSRPSPPGAPLRFAALTRVSLRGFWVSRLIARQKNLVSGQSHLNSRTKTGKHISMEELSIGHSREAPCKPRENETRLPWQGAQSRPLAKCSRDREMIGGNCSLRVHDNITRLQPSGEVGGGEDVVQAQPRFGRRVGRTEIS